MSYRFFNDALTALAKGEATQAEVLELYSHQTIAAFNSYACRTDAEVVAYWALLEASKGRQDAEEAMPAPQSQGAPREGAWCRSCGGPVSDGSASCGECRP